MAGKEAGSKDKIEMLGGRNVVVPGDGGPHYWQDTTEIVTPDERRFFDSMGSAASLDFKAEQKQNPDIVFYTYEAAVKENERPELNPIRGIVLDIFQRPDNFAGADDDEQSKMAEGDKRLRIASWWLLTAETYVKTLGKKVRKARPGEKVWVDLNQATMNIVRIAAPSKDKDGKLIKCVEAAIDPKLKETFQATLGTGKQETRQAWRVGVYGGWSGGPSFRKFNSAEEIQKKLGSLTTLPSSFLSDTEIASAIGLTLPTVSAVPALPG